MGVINHFGYVIDSAITLKGWQYYFVTKVFEVVFVFVFFIKKISMFPDPGKCCTMICLRWTPSRSALSCNWMCRIFLVVRLWYGCGTVLVRLWHHCTQAMLSFRTGTGLFINVLTRSRSLIFFDYK